MADEQAGFFTKITDGVRKAVRHVKTYRRIRRLNKQRSACEGRLSEAYEALGAAAEQEQAGRDSPEFAEVARCRAAVDQAGASLADRQGALKAANERLLQDSTARTKAVAAADTDHKQAADAASKSAGELKTAQKMAAADAEARKEQARLESLKASLGGGESATKALAEPADQVNTRLAALRQQRADLDAKLAAARQTSQQSSAAAKAKDGELKKATKAAESSEAACRKELASAQASTLPDRDAKVQAAQKRLGEEVPRNRQAIAALDAEARRLGEIARADAAKGESIGREVEALAVQIKLAETVLAVRDAEAQLARRTTDRAAAGERATKAQGQADQAAKAEQAKAAALQQTKQAAGEAQARQQADVSAAAATVAQTQQETKAAQAQLAQATGRLGKKVYDSGLKAGKLEKLFALVEKVLADIVTTDTSLAQTKAEKEATRGAAIKTALIAGGAVAVLVAAGITIYVLVR